MVCGTCVVTAASPPFKLMLHTGNIPWEGNPVVTDQINSFHLLLGSANSGDYDISPSPQAEAVVTLHSRNKGKGQIDECDGGTYKVIVSSITSGDITDTSAELKIGDHFKILSVCDSTTTLDNAMEEVYI